ncbi:MAG TPA: hypothetical protein VFD58_29625 [Blastocatellia bacterium]|nr:hypothetical protein [Blastocatellia bacterium]
MRIYLELAGREPHEELRTVLLRLATQAETRAARRAAHLRQLHQTVPDDRDPPGARVWRWILVRCGLRWSLGWIDRVEHDDLVLCTLFGRLVKRVSAVPPVSRNNEG